MATKMDPDELVDGEVVEDVVQEQAIFTHDQPGPHIQILRADGNQGPSFLRVVNLSDLNGGQSNPEAGGAAIIVSGSHTSPSVIPAQVNQSGVGNMPTATASDTQMPRLFTVTTPDGIHLAGETIPQTLNLNGGGSYFVIGPPPEHSNQLYGHGLSQTSGRSKSSFGKESPKLVRDEKRRSSHNEVERRRRDKINQWIFKLADMIPDFHVDTRQGQSKGVILSKCCEYISQLQRSNSELTSSLSEAERLAVQHEQLRRQAEQAEHHVLLLEKQLLENGLKPTARPLGFGQARPPAATRLHNTNSTSGKPTLSMPASSAPALSSSSTPSSMAIPTLPSDKLERRESS